MQFARHFTVVLLLLSVAACAQVQKGTIRHPDGAKKAVFDYVVEDAGQIRHGSFREWYEDGQLKAQGHYQLGYRHGRWTEWYENGQKRFEGSFDNNRPTGRFEFWYEDGERMAELIYRDGEEEPLEKFLYIRAGGTLTEQSFEYEGLRAPPAVKTFREAVSVVQRCFEAELRRDPTFSGGTAVVHFGIDLGGRTFGAHMTEFPPNRSAFETCFIDALEELHFERPAEAFITMTETFVLSR